MSEESKKLSIDETDLQRLMADLNELQSLVGRQQLELNRYQRSYEALNMEYQKLRSQLDETKTP